MNDSAASSGVSEGIRTVNAASDGELTRPAKGGIKFMKEKHVSI